MSTYDDALPEGTRGVLPRLERADAFHDAARHSRTVRLLKRSILIGCLVAMAGILAYSLFDPFGKLPQNISIAQAGLNGTRITMQFPKLSGYMPDGRPYDVRADSGVQDIRKPNILELNNIEARFDTPDKQSMHMVAPFGVYDSSTDHISLRGGVHISSDSGYDVRMSNAEMNVKSGTVETQEPVSIVMSAGTVNSDRMTISDNGHIVTFIGNVRSLFKTDGQTSKDAQ